jgi:hypothetical protein
VRLTRHHAFAADGRTSWRSETSLPPPNNIRVQNAYTMMFRARRTVFGKPLIEGTIKVVAKRLRTPAEKLKGNDRR